MITSAASGDPGLIRRLGRCGSTDSRSTGEQTGACPFGNQRSLLVRNAQAIGSRPAAAFGRFFLLSTSALELENLKNFQKKLTPFFTQ
jgi:hypothetical protein